MPDPQTTDPAAAPSAPSDVLDPLSELARGVTGPARRAPIGVVTGLGRLEEIAAWASRVQDRDAPEQFRQARVILLGDPVADDEPRGRGADRLQTLIDAIDAPVGVEPATVPSRVAGDAGPPIPGSDSHRAVAEWAPSATEWAVRLVDAEVDAGADLLILASHQAPGLATGPVSHDAAALALISLLCRVEPSALVRYDLRRDDALWMSELSQIRDARRAAASDRRTVGASAVAIGTPVLVAGAALLLHAARRRTPVILDGLAAMASGLVASTLAPGVAGWWQLAGAADTPADQPIAARLGLAPVAALGSSAPDGAAGVLVSVIVRIAIAAATSS